MYHLSQGEAEDVEDGPGVSRLLSLAPSQSLCVNLEVTREMRGRRSYFSRSEGRPVCGTNYVVHSHLPREIFTSKTRRIEGIHKVKKVHHIRLSFQKHSDRIIQTIIILLMQTNI